MNEAQRDFLRRLNEYVAIWRDGGGSEVEQLTARIIRGIDRPQRRRRYLSTQPNPSIDDYIDFAHQERNRT